MKKDTVSKVKFKRLQRHLKLPLWQTIGLLESLWHCALTNAPDGDIGRLSNDDIAAAIEWEDDADNLVNALVQTGWLDTDDQFRLIVHDWSQHVPNFLKGAYEKHEKQFADEVAKQRAKHDTEQPAKQDAKQPARDGAYTPATYPSQVNPILKPLPSEPIQTKSDAAASVVLPASIDSKEMQVAWANWVRHRKEIKSPLTPTQTDAVLRKLERWGISRSLAAIENTIENGWIGLREPDGAGKSRGDPGDPRGTIATGQSYLAKRQKGLLNGDSENDCDDGGSAG